MDKAMIKNEIVDIIEKKIGIEKENVLRYATEYSLFDPLIGMKPRDLLTLFFEIQKVYKITFREDDILNRRFDYLDGIVEAVAEKAV